jgi:hypothetical protein
MAKHILLSKWCNFSFISSFDSVSFFKLPVYYTRFLAVFFLLLPWAQKTMTCGVSSLSNLLIFGVLHA